MAFPPEFLDELRLRMPPSVVVGKRVKLVKRGREHSGLCPFHNEKTPSFTVSDDKGFYHCFGCAAHGDVISFVMESEGLSFPEAIERLAAEAGLAVPQSSPQDKAQEARRASLREVLESVTLWFQEQLDSSAGEEARRYLAGRGLERETIARFRLGFAPDRRGALRQALQPRGIDDDQLIEAGLLKAPEDGGHLRDYFFNRIIFPITDRKGAVIAFGGRAMGDSKAKYLNSPETTLFHKGRVLYNLAGARQAARDSGELVIAEGYMDVIALAQAGFPAAVAPLGTAVTEEQLAELWRLAQEPIFCLDGDSAGQRAAFRAAERALPELAPGRSLRFALLPQGEDPDSLLQRQGAGALRALLDAAKPFADILWLREYQAQRVSTPEGQAQLAAGLKAAVEQMRHAELREAYLERLAQLFRAAFGYSPWRGKGWGGPRQPRRGRTPRDRTGRAAPVARLGARQPPDLLPRRRIQVLLACLINHPDLLLESAESLADLDFVASELHSFFRALIDAAAQHTNQGADLDSEVLRCHLSNEGYSGVLEGLLSPEVYVHGKFARPDASKEAARAGLLHLVSVFRDRQTATDQAEEGRELASDMSKEKLARMQARQKLNQEGAGQGPDLDHFEAISREDVT